MTIGENVAARISYKAYATGVISSNSQPTSSSDPGASGAQILRRTGCTLNLSKDTYQAEEIRSDYQNVDYRHGVKKVGGSLSGELSPGTYFDFIEAACRGTKSSALSKSNTEFTSVTAENTASTFTFTGGDPVSEGFRVGHPIRFANLSVTANNSKNFVITGFGGTSNRVVSVYPAPTDMASADSSFTVVSVGKRVYVPSSSFVKRKFAVEDYHTVLDIHRLFTECRVGGVDLNLPATGMSTIEIPMVGRDMETASGASSPFFSSPTSETTTGILAAVNGLVRVGGVNQGVITGAQIKLGLNPQTTPVIGQSIVPDIVLGRANVSGQITAMLEDLTLINYFKNETEIELLLYLAASSADAADAMTIYVPRVKFGNAEVGLQGEQGVPVTMPFQAIKYIGSGAGIDTTTIAFCDTAAS